jgi:hypothetical protein
MVRKVGSVCSEDEKLKNILVCELFYRIARDNTRPLLETKSENKYILVAIDHYSKWCEAKTIVDHGAKTAARFLEDDIICRCGVPKFVLTNNGGEWATKFDVMCNDYVITINIQHLNGNGIKHGITVFFITPKNAKCWDEQLTKVMFGYRCKIQTSTKFSLL